MNRTQIINALIKKHGYKSFLEIGTNTGVNSRGVECETKVGVDPEPLESGLAETTFIMTSDDYFLTNTRKFDIYFVDGLHHSDQVYRDINNCLDHLNEGGTIVCHDMSPRAEIEQRVPRETKIWNGDCWKSFLQLRMERDDLEMYVIDSDWGVGIIRKGKQTKLKIKEDITFENLEKNRKEWLNLISVEEFIGKL